MIRSRRPSPGLAAGAVLVALASTASAQFTGDPLGTGIVPMGGMAGPSGLGGNQGSSLLPGVRTTLSFSDNILRRTGGDEVSGIRTEVAPYLNASINGPRAQAAMSYTLRSFYTLYGDDSSSAVRHDLSARGNALLLGDWFGIQGQANSFQANTSAFGTLAADPATSSVNTNRVTTATVSPYVIGRAGTFANYRAQYSLTHTDVSGTASNLLGRRNEQVMASLSSGPQFRTWGWSIQSSGNRREFANGLQVHTASTVGSLNYAFTPELRVGVSANYLYIERLENRQGENRGWGPGVSLDWVPSQRTTLRVSVVDQYYGSNTNISLAHRGERWTFGLNYGRAVMSSNNAGILTMNLGSLLSGGGYAAALNPVFQQLVAAGVLNPDTTLVGAGIVNDALVRQRMFSASVGYVLPRGALTMTGFRNVRETLLDSSLFLPASDPLITSSFGHFETRGGTVSLTYPFDAVTSGNLSGTASDILAVNSSDRARLSLLSATLSTRLDAKTSITTGVRRVVQSRASGSVGGYDENQVFGTMDMRF